MQDHRGAGFFCSALNAIEISPFPPANGNPNRCIFPLFRPLCRPAPIKTARRRDASILSLIRCRNDERQQLQERLPQDDH